MADKVFIFDTTLRDGEQVPGETREGPEVEIGAQLRAERGHHRGGFPASSPGDFESVQRSRKRQGAGHHRSRGGEEGHRHAVGP